MTGPRGPHPKLDAAALDAASQEYLRVFATHREALVAAIRVYLAAVVPCVRCGGRGYLGCHDPQHGDSTWDHYCTDGSPCPECRP